MPIKSADELVEGTALETFTDELGAYRVDGVPVGRATLKAFFTGLKPFADAMGLNLGILTGSTKTKRRRVLRTTSPSTSRKRLCRTSARSAAPSPRSDCL